MDDRAPAMSSKEAAGQQQRARCPQWLRWQAASASATPSRAQFSHGLSRGPHRPQAPQRPPPGRPAACHARPVLIRPAAHRRITPPYRAASCEACGAVSPSRLPFALAPQSLLVGRSAARGGRHCGKAASPHPPRHPNRLFFLSSRRGEMRENSHRRVVFARVAPN